jgi:hypothetical protein
LHLRGGWFPSSCWYHHCCYSCTTVAVAIFAVAATAAAIDDSALSLPIFAPFLPTMESSSNNHGGASVVLGLSLRTLGCHSSNRKHQNNRMKGIGRTKGTYKWLKELGFHFLLPTQLSWSSIYTYTYLLQRQKCPSNYPDPKAYSKSSRRFWSIPPLASHSNCLPRLVPSALQLAQGGPAKGIALQLLFCRFRLFVTQRQKWITCTTHVYQVEMKVSCWAKGLLHPSDEMPSTRPKDLLARRKASTGRCYLPMTLLVARRQCR